jgi:hypothetical protein
MDVVLSKLKRSMYGAQFDTEEKLTLYAGFLSNVEKLKGTRPNVD